MSAGPQRRITGSHCFFDRGMHAANACGNSSVAWQSGREGLERLGKLGGLPTAQGLAGLLSLGCGPAQGASCATPAGSSRAGKPVSVSRAEDSTREIRVIQDFSPNPARAE